MVTEVLEKTSVENICKIFCLQLAVSAGPVIIIQEPKSDVLAFHREIVASSIEMNEAQKRELLGYDVSQPGPGHLFGNRVICLPVSAARSRYTVILGIPEINDGNPLSWPGLGELIQRCAELGAEISLLEMQQIVIPGKKSRPNSGSRDLLFIIHPDIHAIVYGNAVALAKLGYTEMEFLASPVDIGRHMDQEKLSILISQCLKSNVEVKAVSYLTMLNGQGFPVQLIMSRIEQSQGAPAISLRAKDLSGKIKYELECRDLFNKYRFLAERLSASLEAERLKISRDVHDVICGSISGIMIQLENIRNRIPLDERELFNRIIGDCEYVLGSARRISRGLRPDLLDNMGLLPAIEQLLMDFGRKYDIRTRLICDESGVYLTSLDGQLPASEENFQDAFESTIFCEPNLNNQQKIELYRIVQEALNNVLKHASASYVCVNAWREGNQFVLGIRDNGCGFNQDGMQQQNNGLGLLGMMERARSAKGRLMVNSNIGKGTSVIVQVDVPEE